MSIITDRIINFKCSDGPVKSNSHCTNIEYCTDCEWNISFERRNQKPEL